MQAALEERIAIAKEKELAIAKQQKAQKAAGDKAAKEDELRARRYQEAKEREARAKDKAAVSGQPHRGRGIPGMAADAITNIIYSYASRSSTVFARKFQLLGSPSTAVTAVAWEISSLVLPLP